MKNNNIYRNVIKEVDELLNKDINKAIEFIKSININDNSNEIILPIDLCNKFLKAINNIKVYEEFFSKMLIKENATYNNILLAEANEISWNIIIEKWNDYGYNNKVNELFDKLHMKRQNSKLPTLKQFHQILKLFSNEPQISYHIFQCLEKYITPNEHTWYIIISNWSKKSQIKALQIFEEMCLSHNSPPPNIPICNLVIESLIEANNIDAANNLFQDMCNQSNKNFDLPKPVKSTYILIIHAYVKISSETCLYYYNDMIDKKIHITIELFNLVLKSLAVDQKYESCIQLINTLNIINDNDNDNKLIPNHQTWRLIFLIKFEAQMYKECISDFEKYKKYENCLFDAVCWTIVIKSYFMLQDIENALRCFNLLCNDDKIPNPYLNTYHIMIDYCGKFDKYEEVEEIFEKLCHNSLDNSNNNDNSNKNMNSNNNMNNNYEDINMKCYVNADSLSLIMKYCPFKKRNKILQLFYESCQRYNKLCTIDLSLSIASYDCEDDNMLKYYRIKYKNGLERYNIFLEMQSIHVMNMFDYILVFDELAKHGLIDQQLSIFKMIRTKYPSNVIDPLSWLSILRNLIDCGRIDTSIDIFNELQNDPTALSPNINICNCMLKLFRDRHDVQNCHILFNKMKMNYNEFPLPDTLSCTTMLRVLSENDNIESCIQLFHEMLNNDHNNLPKPDSNCYSTMIRSLAIHNRHIDAYELFICMYNAYLKNNKSPRPTEVIWNTVLKALAKNDMVDKCLILFNLMQSSDQSPSELLCNTIIKTLSRHERIDDLLMLFNDMKNGINNVPLPGEVTYTSVIKALSQAGRIDECFSLFQMMRQASNVSPNVVTWNTVIKALSDNNKFDLSMELFNEMKNNINSIDPNIPQPDEFTWTTVLRGLSQIGKIDECVSLFNIMCTDDKAPNPDAFTFTTIIKALADSKRINECIVTFNSMINNSQMSSKQFPRPNVVTCNTVIKAMSDSGRINDCIQLFNEMRAWNDALPSPDTITWTTVIKALCDAGMINDCVILFDEMRLDNTVKPDQFTWTIVLQGLAKHDLIKCLELFEEMRKKSDILPNVITWNTILSSFRKSHQYQNVMYYFRLMCHDMNAPCPDSVTWTIVESCCKPEDIPILRELYTKTLHEKKTEKRSYKAKKKKNKAFNNSPRSTGMRSRRLKQGNDNHRKSQYHTLHKTRLCNSYTKTGTCQRMDNCIFAHGESELRCYFYHVNGKCKYGSICNRIH